MKQVTLVVLVLLFSVLVLAADVIKFDSETPGSVPRGWTVGMTHPGNPPVWEIVVDSTGPSKRKVLAQTSKSTDHDRYPICVYDNSNLKDGEVSVSYKLVGGRLDATAGVIWRYKDPDNYYVVRVQGLGDNIIFFKVVNGKRSEMAPMGGPSYGRAIKRYVSMGVWSTLRVTFNGPLFTVYMNGEKLADVADVTFTEAGKVGVWTKSDTIAYFDNFEFK